MKYLKDLYLDLLVLVAIIAFYFTNNDVLYIVLWVYTALLFIGRILTIFMPALQRKAGKSEINPAIYHALYGFTVVALIFSEAYYMSLAWVVIWILSYISYRKSSGD